MSGKWFALVLLVFVGTCCTGCAQYGGGQVYASPAWEQAHGSAGKVLLIVAAEQRQAVETDVSAKTHTAMVTKATVAALNQLPGTTVVNAADMPALWAHDAGDVAAVAQAKAKGADTVCVLTMGEYGGSFAFGLPVLWSGRTDILYSLRLIDVKSGDLLAHAVIHRVNGGEFRVVPFDDLKKGMEQSLHRALWHPPVAPAPAPSTAPSTAERLPSANDQSPAVSG